MKRRDFIKTSVVTPLILGHLLAENDKANTKFRPGDAKSFDLLEVKGSYQQVTQKHFPHLLEKVKGMADGAGLHFDAVWAVSLPITPFGTVNK